jgi:hypothetical protein
MNFPDPSGVTVFFYNGSGFDQYIYDADAGGWSPSAPVPAVGQSFFIDNASGAQKTWSRTFPVGS